MWLSWHSPGGATCPTLFFDWPKFRYALIVISSSSSSDTVQGVQGSVLLPHYRTLEVRPGRIS